MDKCWYNTGKNRSTLKWSYNQRHYAGTFELNYIQIDPIIITVQHRIFLVYTRVFTSDYQIRLQKQDALRPKAVPITVASSDEV